MEIAEIYPVFAYQINGQYRVKDNLKRIDNYYQQVNNNFSDLPGHLNNWLQSKLLQQFFEKLDAILIEVASKVNKKTEREIHHKIKDIDNSDSDEWKQLFEELILEFQSGKEKKNNLYVQEIST